jgi:ABC-type Fe3+-hydroxamate transport system substrate-binding protein
MEALIARAPEALLLVRGGKVNIETLQKLPGWSSMAAIKAGKVYYVDKGIEDPSPVAINALEELARVFHP